MPGVDFSEEPPRTRMQPSDTPLNTTLCVLGSQMLSYDVSLSAIRREEMSFISCRYCLRHFGSR